jgi:two-component system response regulator HydG
MARILLVDDEPKMVALLESSLQARGHATVGLHDGQSALDRLERETFDVVITDLRMAPVDGMAVIEGSVARKPDTPVVVLTAHGEIHTAVAALRAGAFHYLTKPVDFEEVARVVDLALEAPSAGRPAPSTGTVSGIVGDSPAARRLMDLIGRVAPTEATVLIRGESGTGKELAARAIHDQSPRAKAPFVAVNCAAITESLLESELFGYRKGAFTGAQTDREGLFEAASGGTVFLDEIGEAPLSVQAKLLRVLEERKISRVGDPIEREVNVRVIAATNRPLDAEVKAGHFRQDLYYRLAVFPVDVPPLRERGDDLQALWVHFLARLGRPRSAPPAATLKRLRAHGWPGNVRELRNVVERAHILAGPDPIADEHVMLDRSSSSAEAATTLDLDENARQLIREALRRAHGNKTQAAELLGITRRTLYSRLKLLGMEDETGEESP